MKIGSNLFKSIFFLLGERIAFIFVIIVFTLLLFVETTHTAFSEEEEVIVGYSRDGLTYDYYLNSSYTYSADMGMDTASITHTEEPILSHNVFIEPNTDEIWEKIASCESKGNWGINTGNGYYGGLQFSEGAWRSVGGAGLAHEASRDEQIMRGKMLQEKRGWGAWGLCAKKLGL